MKLKLLTYLLLLVTNPIVCQSNLEEVNVIYLRANDIEIDNQQTFFYRTDSLHYHKNNSVNIPKTYHHEIISKYSEKQHENKYNKINANGPLHQKMASIANRLNNDNYLSRSLIDSIVLEDWTTIIDTFVYYVPTQEIRLQFQEDKHYLLNTHNPPPKNENKSFFIDLNLRETDKSNTIEILIIHMKFSEYELKLEQLNSSALNSSWQLHDTRSQLTKTIVDWQLNQVVADMLGSNFGCYYYLLNAYDFELSK